MKNALIELYHKNLDHLQKEINAYSSEAVLWVINANIKNSGGNLALHLIGNLNHYIGATLGNSGYIRKRDHEFNDKNIPKKNIINQIDELKTTLENTITSLDQEDFSKTYPINVFGKEMTTEYFLLHLLGHLNYHLGQISYHRRLLDNC